MSKDIGGNALQAATQLAAAGDYQAATELLDGLGEAGGSVEVRLLRAKIAAQQGQYDQAVEYWQDVLSDAPDNSEAREGTRRARRRLGSPHGPFYVRSRLYYAGLLGVSTVLLLLVAIFATLAWSRGGNSRLQETLQTHGELLQHNREAIDAVARVASDTDRRIADLTSAMDGRQQLLARTLATTRQDMVALREAATRDTNGIVAAANAASKADRDELRRVAGELTGRIGQLEKVVAQRLADASATAESRHKTFEKHLAGVERELLAETRAGAKRTEQASADLRDSLVALEKEMVQRNQSLRAEVGGALRLSEEIRAMTAQCRKLGAKFWGPTESDRLQARQDLQKLVDRVDQLLTGSSSLTEAGQSPGRDLPASP